MYLLQHKWHCILGNHRLTMEEKKFSSRKKPQGEVSMATAGSSKETPQRRIALLSGDKVVQLLRGRSRPRKSGDGMGDATSVEVWGVAGWADERRGEELRGHGRWCQGQTGKGIGYEMILATGMDNE